MLLIYTTDVKGTGEFTKPTTLSDGQPGIEVTRGTLPAVALRDTAKFTLKVSLPASGYKAYKLDLNG
jgi:hypothetical protein